MNVTDFLRANPEGTREQYLAQAPVAKPSSPATYVTYLSIGEDTARFGPGAINVAGTLRSGLETWCAGPDLSATNPALPNPGALQTIHERLAGAKGVDLSSPTAPIVLALLTTGVDAAHPPLLTAEQATALLSIGYDLPDPCTPEQFAAATADNDRELAAGRLAVVLDRARNATADVDPADRDAVRAALLAGFDDAWPEGD